jgi:hypothetical protein
MKSVLGSLLKLTLDYVRYSGVTVCLHVNPFHWSWIPRVRQESQWVLDQDRVYAVSWLFVTFRFWIDDGRW